MMSTKDDVYQDGDDLHQRCELPMCEYALGLQGLVR